MHLIGLDLSWVIVFVVVAFTTAGFASLPPILKYQEYMIVTLVLGLLIYLHDFSSACILDPFIMNRYSAFIDPTFYASKLSGLLERFFRIVLLSWLPVIRVKTKAKEGALQLKVSQQGGESSK